MKPLVHLQGGRAGILYLSICHPLQLPSGVADIFHLPGGCFVQFYWIRGCQLRPADVHVGHRDAARHHRCAAACAL